MILQLRTADDKAECNKIAEKDAKSWTLLNKLADVAKVLGHSGNNKIKDWQILLNSNVCHSKLKQFGDFVHGLKE